MAAVALIVNGQPSRLELDTRTTLLDALREHLQHVGGAIANAIYNATGIRERHYPIKLDKLLDRMPDMASQRPRQPRSRHLPIGAAGQLIRPA